MIDILPNEEYLKRLPEATIICSGNSYFDDDIEMMCELKCGRKIYLRPYNKPAKKKICMHCFTFIEQGTGG
jgi:hypothetical protein